MTIKPVIINAMIAARRGDIQIKLKLPGNTTVANLHVACLRAVKSQSPENYGKPISALEYDVRANA